MDHAESTPYMDALRELAEVKAERDRYRKVVEGIAKTWGVSAEDVLRAYTDGGKFNRGEW